MSLAYIAELSLLRDKVPDFGCYPFTLPTISALDKLSFHPKITYFSGENGSGKSTLLEAIAVALGFNPEGGSRNFSFHTRRSHSDLHEYIRISKGTKRPRNGYYLRAESFFNVATEIERLDEEPFGGPPIISYYGGKSLHEQSHGEAFWALIMERFGDQGLYILDEPEAALSPQKQLAVLARINDLINRGSQFVIATHSPIILAYPYATIYDFASQGIREIKYTETDSFQITRRFILNHDQMIQSLFADR